MNAPWLWRIGFPPFRALALAIFPIKVRGLEHLPRSGGYIVVANHISWYDPPAVEFALNVPLRYMAKQEVFAIPVIGLVLRLIGNFPVRRGEADRGAVKQALRVVAAGAPLGFFVEGTRSRDGAMRRARPGVAFITRRAKAPIVPVAVQGTRTLRLGPASRIEVEAGPAFRLDELPESDRASDEAIADAIARRIAALLPAEMRGHYAEVV